MTRRDWQRVERIALRVRRTIERLAGDGSIGEDEVTPPPSLKGACGAAAYLLTKLLQQAGFKALLVDGNGHCWTELDGRVIDVTATQFQHRRRPREVFFDYIDGRHCGHTPMVYDARPSAAEYVFEEWQLPFARILRADRQRRRRQIERQRSRRKAA